MTRYLLDTDALIDFSKSVEPATSLILSWIDGSDIVAVCPITVAEFYAGLEPEEAVHWQRFMVDLGYWDISVDAAMQAGQYRYSRARVGRRITTTDALVAGVAVEHDATLVTGNVKDFSLEGLRLLSIR